MVWAVVCKVLPKLVRALPSLTAQNTSPRRGQQNVMLDGKQTMAGQRYGNLHKCSVLFRSSTESYIRGYSFNGKTCAH